MQSKVPLITILIALVIIGLFCFQNLSPVPMQFFGSTMNLPLAGIIFASFIIGLAPTASSGLVKQKKTEISKAKEEEWEKHDQKLAKEIGSDHVKQLEAKIETLETALKAALTKKK